MGEGVQEEEEEEELLHQRLLFSSAAPASPLREQSSRIISLPEVLAFVSLYL